MKATLNPPFRGIVTPMATPLRDNETLDVAGLENLIEHILDGGVNGLFILGTTGEAPSLSYTLRHELIEKATRLAAGRVPVLVGITDTSFSESLNIAELAHKHGADALVLAPPYYCPPGQPELLDYLERLAARLPLPLFLYNMPGFTKVSFDPRTVKKAAQIDGIVGLKDSSGDMIYFNLLKTQLSDHPDFSLMMGPDELLGEAVLMGAHGGVCSGSNLFPELYVGLYNAAVEQNVERVKLLHKIVMEVSANIYGLGQYSSRVLKGIKCALGIMNICSDFVAEPFSRFQQSDKHKMEDALNDIKKRCDHLCQKR